VATNLFSLCVFHAEGYYGSVCDCVTCLARYWLFPLFCLYVWNGQCLWYSWRLSIVTAIRSGPCCILGLLPNLRAVLSHRTPIPVILYLYSFDFRTIPGYLRFFGAGVRDERLFVDKKEIQERKSQQPNSKQLIKLEQANDSTRIETIQSHATSLSVWTRYCLFLSCKHWAGVRDERLFVDKKEIQERKSQQPNSKQLIKLEQANDSTRIETIQSHATSLSVWTRYCLFLSCKHERRSVSRSWLTNLHLSTCGYRYSIQWDNKKRRECIVKK
jgi:hypothetical protein